MHDLVPIYVVLTALAATVIASIATTVRVLPEVIDISIIPTFSGVGSLGFTTYGAMRRFHPDRVGRLALAGTVVGGGIGVLIILIELLREYSGLEMLRFLAPYFIPLAVLTVLASVLYGESVINAAGVYGLIILGIPSAAVGYARWDLHKHPDDPR
jgi:hypothetical protein